MVNIFWFFLSSREGGIIVANTIFKKTDLPVAAAAVASAAGFAAGAVASAAGFVAAAGAGAGAAVTAPAAAAAAVVATRAPGGILLDNSVI